MLRPIKFKGKKFSGNWIEGFYFFNKDNDHHYINSNDHLQEINPETRSQFTGKTTCKSNELFENDIVFNEIEKDEGDLRIYYVCKWIPEWARFVFLSYGELFQYEDYGINRPGLEDDGTFGLENSEKMHYAGNIFDNKELWENPI